MRVDLGLLFISYPEAYRYRNTHDDERIDLTESNIDTEFRSFARVLNIGRPITGSRARGGRIQDRAAVYVVREYETDIITFLGKDPLRQQRENHGFSWPGRDVEILDSTFLEGRAEQGLHMASHERIRR